MLYKPTDTTIAKHIDYYWIVENSKAILGNATNLHAYPGVTPDLLIVLDGYYEYKYEGKYVKQNQSILFSFIHKEIKLNLSQLGTFILVKFKSRALGALQPFTNYKSSEIMQNPAGFSNAAFNATIPKLANWMRNLSNREMVIFLDDWLLSHYKKEREGFVVEMAEEICPDFNLQTIMEETNYSYSTIERYFKRETGLTPKKYQSLKRCKEAITEICATKNDDWIQYVSNYKYYDQAHFIKDIKRFTKFTPKQLLETPSFVTFRPVL